MSNPFDMAQIKEGFETLGQSAMPWGTHYAIFVIILFGWMYIAIKAGFEKSLLNGFFMLMVGLVLQWFIFGVDSAFKLMAVIAVFDILIYLMFVRKL